MSVSCMKGMERAEGVGTPTASGGQAQRRVALLAFTVSLRFLPLLIVACSGSATPSPGEPEPPAERSVIRDTPLEITAAPFVDAAASITSSAELETDLSTSLPPTPVPMRNQDLVTAPAGARPELPRNTAEIRQLSPETRVAELRPDDCGALSLSDRDARGDCQSGLLRAGVTRDRTFLGLLVFDLSGLPPANELLYAGLELTVLDDEFADAEGRWLLSAVALPGQGPYDEASFAQILAAPALEPRLGWHIAASDATLGAVMELDFGPAGLQILAERMGRERLAFRIEDASRTEAAINHLSWYAGGEAAPVLRLAYAQPEAEGE